VAIQQAVVVTRNIDIMEEGTRNMTNYRSVLSIAAAAAVMGAVSIPALAVTSSFGFNTSGTVTYTPGPPSTVDLATAISVVAPPAVNYTTNGSVSNFFTGLPTGTVVHLDSNTFTNLAGVDFTISSPGFDSGDTLTFTAAPLTALLGPGTNNGAIATNGWTENGTLTDTTNPANLPGGAQGQLSLSAIQNLNPFSPNPNASWVFSSNTLPVPPPTTPEPGSVAMLVGLGLSSAGFMMRRRRK